MKMNLASIEAAIASENQIDDLSQAYEKITSQIDRLCFSGHDENSEKILELMTGFYQDNLAIRFLIKYIGELDSDFKLSSAQSVILSRGESHIVRLNFWPSEDGRLHQAKSMVQDYYSIGVWHNHTFDFFTIGLAGPGYKTEFLGVDDMTGTYMLGDKIKADRAWSFQLNKGRSAYVRALNEFHCQNYPSEFSVSLNVIPYAVRKSAMSSLSINRQYIIDGGGVVTRVLVPKNGA